MKKLFACLLLSLAAGSLGTAQVLLSGGLSYSQNFDSLSNTPAATSGPWTDNATPGMVGWYASRAFQSGTTSAYGPYAYTTYRIGDGSANNGSVWSFGTIGNADRALGSLSSGTPKTNVFGARILNDTANSLDNVTVSYTGEQWRNGGNTTVQTLTFSYQISNTGFTSPIGVDSAPNNGWIGVSALDFSSPVTGATAATLDGNQPANRVQFSNIVIPGILLTPGQEIFLRWLDIDDSGNDHGYGVDDFTVTFAIAVPEPSTLALLGLGGGMLLLLRRRLHR